MCLISTTTPHSSALPRWASDNSSTWGDISLKQFVPLLVQVVNLSICLLCVARAVQNDSSGEQEGLWDWPCECDGQRRPWNRKLGSQVRHNQWPQRQLQNQYRPCHQPGGSDGGEGTVYCHSTTYITWELIGNDPFECSLSYNYSLMTLVFQGT